MSTKSPGQILAALPIAIQEYFNNLSYEDKRQILKIPPELFARIYQSGATYALTMQVADKLKED